MTAWTSDELDRIAAAEELEIAPRQEDGSLRRPVPIWVVRHGDDLYVRSYRGPDGVWFRTAQANGEGRIQADGVAKEVSFTQESDPGLNEQIDAAYRAKYQRHSAQYVDPMVASGARDATLKLTPR